jgi:hypothetical protein
MLAAAISAVSCLATATRAQDAQPPAATDASAVTPAAGPQAARPHISDLNGIRLGMTTDEVKAKLGKPDANDAVSMYYDLDNGQSLQLRLDGDKKVTMVALIYGGREAKAPAFAEVLGPEVPLITKENGSIYKQVRYPSEGYWVSYSRLDLETGPMTTVTMQKIAGAP